MNRLGRLKISRAKRAKSLLNKTYDKAFDTGFDQGFARGYSEGYDAGESHLMSKKMQQLLANYELDRAADQHKIYGEAYDAGYDQGYNLGHDDALSIGYEQGVYAGGNMWIDQLLAPNIIMPDVAIQDVIAAGIEHYRSSFTPLLTSGEVAHSIASALSEQRPYSVVRLGDGELLALSQETVLPLEEVQKRGSFLNYAGVQVPDLNVKEDLRTAILHANIVGVPKQRLPNFQLLLAPAFTACGIDFRSLHLCSSIINYDLYYEGLLQPLMMDKTVLVIGNHAQKLTHFLAKEGCKMADPINGVAGFHDIPRVMEEIAGRSFDLAFVCAGIAAVVISQRIATELGRVALDFGHMADLIIDSNREVVT